MKKDDVTKKVLENVAAEFNKIMKLEPPIPTGRKITKAELEKDLVEAAVELTLNDKVSKDAVEALTAIGIKLPEKPAADPGKSGSSNKKGGNSSKPPAKKKDPAAPRFTRIMAVGQVLQKAGKKGITKSELEGEADAVFADKGGKSNPKESKWATNMVVNSLDACGLLTDNDGQLSI